LDTIERREGRTIELAAVADAVSYECEAAFGKVFRRVMGVSPGRYRQEHRAEHLDTEQTS
jgi:AraC-like DNA-binding protein